MKVITLATIIFGLSSTIALSQQILKKEPGRGGLRVGEKVLVDNGRCPKGQVQEVASGRSQGAARGGNRAAFAAGSNVQAGSQRRVRRCVARP